MAVIFAVSPHYLDALYSESRDYDFKLQGYGNLKDACEGLTKVNQEDVLGFVFVSDTMPKKLKNLHRFMAMCNVMCRYRKRIFIFYSNPKQLKQLSGLSDEFTNLDVRRVTNTDVLTNISIRRDLFGTILIDNYEPYNLKIKENKYQLETLPLLEYTPLFTKQLLMVLEPVRVYDSFESTLDLDLVYSRLKQDFQYLAAVRKKKIKLLFNLDCSDDDKAIHGMLNKIYDDKLYCAYLSIFSIVSGGEYDW